MTDFIGPIRRVDRRTLFHLCTASVGAVIITSCASRRSGPSATATVASPIDVTTVVVPINDATADATPAAESPGDPVSAAFEQLLTAEPGVYGVVCIDPERSVRYSRNASTPFIAASLYKLVLMAEIYRMIEQDELGLDWEVELLADYFPGELDYADGYFGWDAIGGYVSIEEALFATGAYSSNVSALALLSLTSPDALAVIAHQLGLDTTSLIADPTQLAWWPPDPSLDTPDGDLEAALAFIAAEAATGPVNITTPRDVAIFFEALLDGRVVSPWASGELFGVLAQQVVDDRFPVLLPTGVELVHKTGNLDHVVHDAGIIYRPDGPAILVAMSEALPNDARATEVIQRLALIAYGDLAPPPIDGTPFPEPDADGSTAAPDAEATG